MYRPLARRAWRDTNPNLYGSRLPYKDPCGRAPPAERGRTHTGHHWQPPGRRLTSQIGLAELGVGCGLPDRQARVAGAACRQLAHLLGEECGTSVEVAQVD